MARPRESKVRVNFTGVEEEIRKHAQRAAKVPDGDYLVKIMDAQMRENEDTGSRGINIRAQIVKPKKYSGKTQYGYCSLKKEALWNLRNLINASLGRNVAGKTVDLDLSKFKDKIVGAVIEEDEYQGKVRSRISTWFPREEFEEAEDDDTDEDEEEEDEYEDEEAEEEEDDEEEDEDDEPQPRSRSRKASSRSRSSRRRASADDEEEEEDLEDVDVEDL